MEPITLALIALGGVALLGRKKKGSHSSGWGVKGSEDRRYYLNQIRDMSFWYSNQFGSMPYLADYLTAIGFRESNFNPASTNPEVKTNPMNAARGLFGMRPETAFNSKDGLDFMQSYPNALLNPRWAFVTAVNGVYRACLSVYNKGSGTPDWVAVRRWWAYPNLVHDFDFSESKSHSNLQSFEKAIHDCNNAYGTNMDPDFIWRDIQGWQNYPGMGVMVKSFGLEGVYS